MLCVSCHKIGPWSYTNLLSHRCDAVQALGSLVFVGALSCEVLVLSGMSAYIGAVVGFGAKLLTH